jgi:RimJ/RimL family protein N-acetyltransferase
MERLGFVKEAHFKDRILFNNSYYDMAVYTLIKGNYTLQ